MYCLACQLHFPDHLNYCKHCGRPLTRASAEADAANEGTRCTRCGARLIPGENFCQQCGAHASSKSEETSIGSCHNCGVLWRSAWLFCKHCGMARANALVTSVASPPASSAPSVAVTAFRPEIKLEEADAATLHCPYCAAEVMPNSRFCEACGGKLRTAPTGDLNPPSVETQPFEDESNAQAEPVKIYDLPPSPMLTDGSMATETTHAPVAAARAQEKFITTPGDNSAAPTSSQHASAAKREMVEIDAVARTGKIESPAEAAAENAREPARPATVVTQIPTATSASPPLRESRQRHLRAAWLTAGIIGLAVLLVLAVGLILQRTRLKKRASATPAPTLAQPARQPMPEAAPPALTPANAAPQPPAGMVYVPGGTFQMGRDDGDEFERPAHAVTVAPFFLDRTEVTNEQYQAFVKQTGHRAPPHWQDGSFPEGAGRWPVVNVSWNDAHEFAKWADKRLPTEEEWEFAARGTDGRLYPWGSEWKPELANTKESQLDRLAEVGSYSGGASPFGALDLCGNVWELTASDLTTHNRRGQEQMLGKVIRGGGFNAAHENTTMTYRGYVQPDETYDKTGFRCAREIR